MVLADGARPLVVNDSQINIRNIIDGDCAHCGDVVNDSQINIRNIREW